MSEWINVKDRLPEPHTSDTKPCPSVVVYYADGVVAYNLLRLSTSNTEYLRRHPEQFTHWMQVSAPPEPA